MPRKAFNADIEAASKKSISRVISVRKGDDDGEINFQFAPRFGPPIDIGLLALDVSGYPSENSFMIFTKSSDVPDGVNEILEAIASTSAGLEISELIANISQRLEKPTAAGSLSNPLDLDGSEDEEMTYDEEKDLEADDESDHEEDDQFDDADFPSDDDDFEGFKSFHTNVLDTSTRYVSDETAAKLNRRIRSDLRAAKFAGFKLGILRGLKAESQTSLLSISIQVSKLGLSNEVLQAWDLNLQQHIVLLIRYSSGYKAFEAVISEPAKSLDVSFRIGVCNKYKPSALEAISAFADTANNGNNPGNEPGNDATRFSSMFISSSLNQFLNDVFTSLVKIRSHAGIGWDGAKLFYKNYQGRPYDTNFSFSAEYYKEKPPTQGSLPEMMKADHIVEAVGMDISFPLVVAQFAMRYLLRCTEFCLVCHDRLPEDFEALKPYVCSNPLCLYQYMSLGFGPSLEHEILTQPFVVDLLVSFCYTAAYGQKMREYPTGMCLLVPRITSHVTNHESTHRQGPAATIQPLSSAPGLGVMARATPQHKTQETSHDISKLAVDSDYIEVKYDHSRKEIIFTKDQPCPVRNGDWITVTPAAYHQLHHRVIDISLYPTVKLSEFAVARGPDFMSSAYVQTPFSGPKPKSPFAPLANPLTTGIVAAKMEIYNQNFDDMPEAIKAEAIILLLETLPPIKEIREYLAQQSRVMQPSLRNWKERITPAALGLLRWIIASNRSCIVQVERCPGQDADDSSIRLDEKCSNVPKDWLQFRFAQGAPDKEQRFLKALKEEKLSLSDRYPTVFAFHGSPMPNWHSIIRHGLDFKDTAHGRAFGHGVYHALDQGISNSYAGSWPHYWPQSGLKIRAAMSLNEIVNCPSKFQSCKPYLVVQHVDWIQCRYLLVQTSAEDEEELMQHRVDKDTRLITSLPSVEIEQDPAYTAKSSLSKPIGVPESAMSVSRAFRKLAVSKAEPSKSHKRRKHTASNGTLSSVETIVSDDEDSEDLNFLFSDDESVPDKGQGEAEKLATLGSKKKAAESQTDFRPGSLNQSELPLLDPPSYATPAATLRLNKELQTILKLQKATPLHELGWYIDVELVTNVYQWIVELHSFDPSLPLARDMNAAGLTSIVLEIRFGKDYPHSPPFVRVIKPRFLPFTQGGGGHVTGGGAMCMELLTNSGWSAASSIEGVLLQVRMAIMNLDPKPARLLHTTKAMQLSYGIGEAIEAYIRACQTHGWQVPNDFKQFRVTSTGGFGGY